MTFSAWSTDRYMPYVAGDAAEEEHVVGKIHGMAKPMAKNVHATMIGALRRFS